jgi:hypothetical protein
MLPFSGRGMEIAANIIEKCDESCQKQLLLLINNREGSDVHREISVICIKNQEETQGKECY